MSGYLLFVAVYLLGLLLDAASTFLCMNHFSDGSLQQEFNPFIRGKSFSALVVFAFGFAAILSSVFALGWSRRALILSKAPRSFPAFCRHIFLGQDPGTPRHPRALRSLVAVAILAPSIVAIGHYRVALTNTLQAMELMHWGLLWIFLSVRLTEIPIYAIVTLLILFQTARNTEP